MAEVGTTIRCKYCGKKFVTRFTTEKYCSKDCYKAVCEIKIAVSNYARSEKKANGTLREKNCIVCGKQFKTKNIRQKCCGGKCVVELKKNKDKYLGVAQDDCIICGKRFDKKRPTQVCCSPECSRIYQRGYMDEPPKNENKEIKTESLSEFLQQMKKEGYLPHEYGKYQAQKQLQG